jgi:predicted enzyme related to lactoylglutathione lyase
VAQAAGMSTDTNETTDAPDAAVAPVVSRVTWFEIGAEDPEAARGFYGELFGWTFRVNGPYSEISYGDDGPHGGIQDTGGPLPDGTPRSYAIPYVQVADVAAAAAAVERLGGKVMVPATEVPPSGLVFAHVRDPFGNHFGLFTPPA